MVNGELAPVGRTDTSIVDALERSPDPAWLWDVGRQRIAWANRAAVEFWRESSPFDLIDRYFSPAEISAIEFGQTFDALDDGQDERITVSLFPSSSAEKADAHCRHHILPDGRKGLLVQLTATSAEEERRALDRVRAALENMPGLVSVFGADGKVIIESQLAAETFGDYSSLPDRMGSTQAAEFFADLFDRGIAHHTGNAHTDLGQRCHRITGKRITDPETGFAAAITLFTDVTDRLALEERWDQRQGLVASEDDRIDTLQTVLDPFPIGVVLLNEKGDIDYANAAAADLLGTEEKNLLSKSLSMFLEPMGTVTAEVGSNTPHSNMLGRDFLNGVDMSIRRPDAHRPVARITLAPLPTNAGVPPFLAVLKDVTSQHEALTTLMRELDSAKEESAQKSQFLANVGHELRTPLNAIIGFSEIMRDQRLGPLENDRYRQYAKDIHHSGHLLLSLINDLLDLSKIQAGKLKLQFAEINLRTVVEQCIRLVQPQAQKKQIRLKLNVPPVLPLVKADARSLEQVVLNLLTNAIKFTNNSGGVTVSIRTGGEGNLNLRVKDTGVGMSPAELDLAMKPFEQIDSTIAHREKGTGLGLPLAKALAEANQAQFRIDSIPDEGTSVELKFPAAQAAG